MPAAETPVAYLGIDVGKSSHSACALDAGGGVAFRAELANRPDDIDRLLERAGSGALVVVDQRRNTSARWSSRAPMRTGTPAPTCQDMPRSRPAGCSPASRRPTPSTPR